jgi:ATP-dependent Clp protease protease subunit
MKKSKEKKRLDELDDLLEQLPSDIRKDTKDFDDLLNLDCALDRNVFLTDITGSTGISIDTVIRFWNKRDKDIPIEKRKPIKIYIDSCGGSLTDSLTVIDAIKASKTPVIGIAIGCAYSGGFFILLACHKRYAYKHASFLYHEGQTGTQGTAGQFANYAAFYKKQLDQLKDIVIEYTNITEQEYMSIKKDDVWYDAEEALEKGIIDGITEELI